MAGSARRVLRRVYAPTTAPVTQLTVPVNATPAGLEMTAPNVRHCARVCVCAHMHLIFIKQTVTNREKSLFYSSCYLSLSFLTVCVCVCVWQLVHRVPGAQTASRHVTVIMEPSAVPQMESAVAALGGQESTVHSV